MFETWLGHWRIIRIYLHQSSLSTTWLWSSKSPNGWTWDIFWKESVWGATSVHPTTLEQRQLLPLWLICTYLKGNSQISIWYHDQATQPVTIWNNPKNKKKENVLPLPCTILLGLGLYFSLSFGVVLYDEAAHVSTMDLRFRFCFCSTWQKQHWLLGWWIWIAVGLFMVLYNI